MITELTEKRKTDLMKVNFEYDGQWVLLRKDPLDGKDYVVAYGDGTEEDWETLHRIVIDRYRGKALLVYGHTPREDVFCGIYDC